MEGVNGRYNTGPIIGEVDLKQTLPVEDINEMSSTLNRLRKLNENRQLWDKLSSLDFVDVGFNSFYPKD